VNSNNFYYGIVRVTENFSIMTSKKKQRIFVSSKNPNYFMLILLGVVLLQSFFLITDSGQKNKTKESLGEGVVPKLEESDKSLVKLAFSPSAVYVRKDETASIDLVLTPKKSLRLDGADIVLSYDPTLIEVVEISTPKLFSLVTQRKTDEKSGRIYLTFLEEKEGGLLLSQESKLLSLRIKAGTPGKGEITILSGDGGTVLTESGSSQKTAFDKGNIKVVTY
jgi:hypothetical protein